MTRHPRRRKRFHYARPSLVVNTRCSYYTIAQVKRKLVQWSSPTPSSKSAGYTMSRTQHGRACALLAGSAFRRGSLSSASMWEERRSSLLIGQAQGSLRNESRLTRGAEGTSSMTSREPRVNSWLGQRQPEQLPVYPHRSIPTALCVKHRTFPAGM